jgi:hypothetical protein
MIDGACFFLHVFSFELFYFIFLAYPNDLTYQTPQSPDPRLTVIGNRRRYPWIPKLISHYQLGRLGRLIPQV